MAEKNNFHAFDDKAFSDAIASVRDQADAGGVKMAQAQPLAEFADSGEMFVTAQCISVTVNRNQICLNLPKPISKSVCVPIPKWVPNGAKLEACIGICYTWKIPTGVKITIYFNGKVLLVKTFGRC